MTTAEFTALFIVGFVFGIFSGYLYRVYSDISERERLDKETLRGFEIEQRIIRKVKDQLKREREFEEALK